MLTPLSTCVALVYVFGVECVSIGAVEVGYDSDEHVCDFSRDLRSTEMNGMSE